MQQLLAQSLEPLGEANDNFSFCPSGSEVFLGLDTVP